MICSDSSRYRHQRGYVAQRSHEQPVCHHGARKLRDCLQNEVTHQHIHHPDQHRVQQEQDFVLDESESLESNEEALEHFVEFTEELAAVAELADQDDSRDNQQQDDHEPPEDYGVRCQRMPYIVNEKSPESPPGEHQ